MNKTTHSELLMGPLPVDKINKTLGLEIEPGDVILSINAQKHALKRHPDNYGWCLPHVAHAVSNPLYVGNDFKNHNKIELVAGIPGSDGEMLLVAVNIEQTSAGKYHVSSFYPISREKADRRREKKHLKRLT